MVKFDSSGNTANLMLRQDTKDIAVVGIDHAVTAIVAQGRQSGSTQDIRDGQTCNILQSCRPGPRPVCRASATPGGGPFHRNLGG